MKRILLFVHYNKYDNLSDHVLYLLEYIRHVYRRIVFISNSPISDNHKNKLVGLYDSIIIRGNRGFDFGVWKDAILQEGWNELAQYDNLTLMNDSCFGPLFDLESVYNQMEQKKSDFWGLTMHPGADSGMPGEDGPIPWHIQSYFMCFNKNVIQSSAFQSFWNNVIYEIEFEKVIQKYETQFTLILVNAGFKSTVLFEISSLQIKEYPGLATYHPDLCIANNVPLLKIKSFIYFKFPQYIIQLLQEKTEYQTSLIFDYFTNMYNPNDSMLFNNKFVFQKNKPNNVEVLTQTVAIHLHVFYLDVFEKYISIFNEIQFKFDLFITTDTSEKKEFIDKYIYNNRSDFKLKEIIVIPNKGRDILPWLAISDKLNDYDIVGHFHTKKSSYTDEVFGIVWQQELFDLMLRPMYNIFDLFSKNVKIGIVIPDIPYNFRINNPLVFSNDSKFQNILNTLWNRMNCKKHINFKELLTVIMPYGNMFWYRPAALKPLSKLRLSSEDIPKEPIPISGTLLHAIERLPVYIAWNEGYDYRIITQIKPDMNSFVTNMLYNKKLQWYENKYNLIENSKSYKIGQLVLVLPRILKKIFVKWKNICNYSAVI